MLTGRNIHHSGGLSKKFSAPSGGDIINNTVFNNNSGGMFRSKWVPSENYLVLTGGFLGSGYKYSRVDSVLNISSCGLFGSFRGFSGRVVIDSVYPGSRLNNSVGFSNAGNVSPIGYPGSVVKKSVDYSSVVKSNLIITSGIVKASKYAQSASAMVQQLSSGYVKKDSFSNNVNNLVVQQLSSGILKNDGFSKYSESSSKQQTVIQLSNYSQYNSDVNYPTDGGVWGDGGGWHGLFFGKEYKILRVFGMLHNYSKTSAGNGSQSWRFRKLTADGSKTSVISPGEGTLVGTVTLTLPTTGGATKWYKGFTFDVDWDILSTEHIYCYYYDMLVDFSGGVSIMLLVEWENDG